jgi:hypothetical protein
MTCSGAGKVIGWGWFNLSTISMTSPAPPNQPAICLKNPDDGQVWVLRSLASVSSGNAM